MRCLYAVGDLIPAHRDAPWASHVSLRETLCARRSLLPILNAGLRHLFCTAARSFAALRQPFAALRQPFTVLRQPFTVLREPFTVFRQPLAGPRAMGGEGVTLDRRRGGAW